MSVKLSLEYIDNEIDKVYLQGYEIAYWVLNHNHSLRHVFVNN
jgi:hypothetical protein